MAKFATFHLPISSGEMKVGSHVDSSILRSSGRSRKNQQFLDSSTEAEGFVKLMVQSDGVAC